MSKPRTDRHAGDAERARVLHILDECLSEALRLSTAWLWLSYVRNAVESGVSSACPLKVGATVPFILQQTYAATKKKAAKARAAANMKPKRRKTR